MKIITELAVTAAIAGTIGAGLTGIYIARVEAVGETLAYTAEECYDQEWQAVPCPDLSDRPAIERLQEDDPGWDCRTGDGKCGPLSDDWGHQPGCYNAQLELVALWPC